MGVEDGELYCVVAGILDPDLDICWHSGSKPHPIRRCCYSPATALPQQATKVVAPLLLMASTAAASTAASIVCYSLRAAATATDMVFVGRDLSFATASTVEPLAVRKPQLPLSPRPLVLLQPPPLPLQATASCVTAQSCWSTQRCAGTCRPQ